jgi:cytochrome c
MGASNKERPLLSLQSRWIDFNAPRRLNLMKKVLLVTVLSLGCAAPALADLALATSKNCMSCHAVDRKVLGPSFQDVAAKYKDNKGAVDLLANKIMKGGSGVWGPVPMPANNQVNEADAKKLATWILTAK